MYAWTLLIAAIASEVAGTVALRMSDGFSRPVPAAVVVVTYGLSFWLLALVLQRFSIGTAYAVWAGLGTAAIAAVGVVVWNEPLNALKLASLGLVIAGVAGLNVAGGH
jgi:multidrug transporter EmrE-like cation transporter